VASSCPLAVRTEGAAHLVRFYEEGYRSGFDHGRLHGLFEGRALGQEKCFELWEEVGYYEGFAGFWVGALSRSMEGRDGTLRKSNRKDERWAARREAER
jgi:hypothetical protein